MELAFITVTLILVFIHFQQPFYIGVNTDTPMYQTTSMLLLTKDTNYIVYRLQGEKEVNKFIVTPLQLSDDNYKQILIKDREIIDYMIDNYGDLMTIEQIDTLKQYKQRIQQSLAGINEMNENDIVKVEYYIYQTYTTLYKRYVADKQEQMKTLATVYYKLKEHQTMPKLTPIKTELLNKIKSQYYLLKYWTHGMEYYYNNIKPTNVELIQESERLINYNYLYNKVTSYYELYKILEDENIVPEDMKKTWDEEIEPLYIDFLRGKSLEFDVNTMQDFIISLLESLRSEANLNLNNAKEYTNQLEIIPFFEKSRALDQIAKIEDKINNYTFDENLTPTTIKQFAQDYKTAKNMKHHVKMMYIRDILTIFIVLTLSLYYVISKRRITLTQKP